VTAQPHPDQAPTPRAMLAGFPRPGRLVEHAYRELDLAMNGNATQRGALGDVTALPRPWDPTSCLNRALRAEVWTWLDQVVTWLNHEYVWAADTTIPSCWPRHPHLVHELAVLADLRHRAGLALTGDAMEEWHRYALPAFSDRMRVRLGPAGCTSSHDPWPAAGAHKRHLIPAALDDRAAAFTADVTTLPDPLQPPTAPAGPTRPPRAPPGTPGLRTPPDPPAPTRPRLQIIDGQKVDTDTGELFD
jgi:hypothetical protein